MPEDNPFGARLRYLRERRGLSREVFGGLVGRSGDWVKAVENGRLMMPRLPLLLRIAEVLHVRELATLTGDLSIPTGEWDKASHERTPAVVKAFLGPTTGPLQQDGTCQDH